MLTTGQTVQDSALLSEPVVRALSIRWWLASDANEKVDRAIMYGIAKSWQTKVNNLLDQNKRVNRPPRTQEELAVMIGIDKTNIFTRGGHSTTLARFMHLAHHLDVAMNDLLPDEVEILSYATSILLQSDTGKGWSNDLFYHSVIYASFQIHRDWKSQQLFDSQSVDRVINYLNKADSSASRLVAIRSCDRQAVMSTVLQVTNRLTTIMQLSSTVPAGQKIHERS